MESIENIKRACTQYSSLFDNEQDFIKSLETDEAFDYFINLGMNEEDVLTAYKMLRLDRGIFVKSESVLSEDKSHLINKLPYNDEEKAKVIEFFKSHSNLESKINWQNKDKQAVIDQIDSLIVSTLENKQANIAKRKVYKELPKFEEHECKVVKETENWVFVAPLSWQGAVYLDSTECGGEGATWCIGWKQRSDYWNGYHNQGDAFIMAYNKYKEINSNEYDKLNDDYSYDHRLNIKEIKQYVANKTNENPEEVINTLCQKALKYMAEIDLNHERVAIWNQPDSEFDIPEDLEDKWFDGVFNSGNSELYALGKSLNDEIRARGASIVDDYAIKFCKEYLGINLSREDLANEHHGVKSVASHDRHYVNIRSIVPQVEAYLNNSLVEGLGTPNELFEEYGVFAFKESDKAYLYPFTPNNIDAYKNFCRDYNNVDGLIAHFNLQDPFFNKILDNLITSDELGVGSSMTDYSGRTMSLPARTEALIGDFFTSFTKAAGVKGRKFLIGFYAKKEWTPLHFFGSNPYVRFEEATGGDIPVELCPNNIETIQDESSHRQINSFGKVIVPWQLLNYCIGTLQGPNIVCGDNEMYHADHFNLDAYEAPGFTKASVEEWFASYHEDEHAPLPIGITTDDVIALWNNYVDDLANDHEAVSIPVPKAEAAANALFAALKILSRGEFNKDSVSPENTVTVKTSWMSIR